MLLQNRLHLVLYFIATMFPANRATSCQVYPSEYSYKDDSVGEHESPTANCRRYQSGLQAGVFTDLYTYCDGTQLKLTDLDLGQEQYQISDYYVWVAGSDAQLLFIFPTRVSLTTITLHYYSVSGVSGHGRPGQGLSRLIFYNVPDDFDVWDAPRTSYPHVDVTSAPPDGEPAGRRSVNINVNFNTKRVLMHKFSSTFMFSVSEVLFTCKQFSILATGRGATTTISTLTTTSNSVITTSNTSAKSNNTTMLTENVTTKKESNASPTIIVVSYTVTDKLTPNSTTMIVAIGVSIAILLILSTILTITAILLIWSYKRRSAKQKLCTDGSYSTLCRGSGLQTQTQSTQESSSELYDQIHLSPSTGQTEYIPKSESTNTNNSSTTPQNPHPTYSTAGENIAEHSSALSATTASQLSSQKAHESTSEQPTYAAIDNSKKDQRKRKDPKHKAGEKQSPISPYAGHKVTSASEQEKKENVTKQEVNPPHTIEELYTAVQKKPKHCEPKGEEETPPIPPHAVEELYTAVQKKPKSRSNADGDNNDHNIPSHTVGEIQVARKEIIQNTTKDLHTAVTDKSNDGSTDGTETAPPIPPYTVEELYTAVVKTPKGNAEDEKEAPPIPPYTIEEN